MSSDASTSARELERRLAAIGSPHRAEGEKRYLKSDLEHLGTTVGQLRSVVRGLVRAHPEMTHAQLTALVRTLWERPVFECRLAAVMLLQASPELVRPTDLPLIQTLVRGSHTWALVDPLAVGVLGTLLVKHPAAARKIDAWSRHADFWVRRAALLSQMAPMKHGAPFDRFAGYADAMLDEREFFIRKAIGWVLRETSKRNPGLVYRWLAPRIERASGVTVREAVKYLEPAQRDALMAAYRRRGRPAGALERS
jgi:3-methyladenine DNA glycosylase AlkD